jgi:peroxiredoxin
MSWRAHAAIVAALLLVPACLMRIGWDFVASGKKLARVPGQVVPDFALPDARTGQLHRLSDDECEATVIVFCGTQWHPARTYIPRLEKYSIAGENRGVQFLIINSDAGESTGDVAKQARELGAAFPVLKDEDNRVADLLAAERVGEALVIDHNGRLRYRGAIDDQFDSDPPRDKPSRNYVLDVIDAVLAGRPVTTESTPVPGPPIKRVASKSQPTVL